MTNHDGDNNGGGKKRALGLKLIRPIFYAAAVLLALLTGYLFIKTDVPAPIDEQIPDEPALSLFPEGRDEISGVKITAEGGEFEITASRPENGMTEYGLEPGFEGAVYDQVKLTELDSVLAGMTYASKAADNPSDELLKQYGIGPQSPVLAVRFGDAEETVTLGEMNVTRDGYYLKYGGAVYIISIPDGEILLQTEKDYRDLRLLPDRWGIPVPDTAISGIVLTRPDGVLEITQATAQELEAESFSVPRFRIKRPVTATGDDDVIYEKFTLPLSMLSGQAVVEDRPEDLAKYGLDAPVRLDVTLDDGGLRSLLIGNSESGSRYVIIEGTDSVLSAPDSMFPFLGVTYADCRSK